MDDIFGKLIKDTSPLKHPALRQACLDARESLGNKHVLLRNPPYEIRQKCFDALQLALESKDKKLMSLSLNGMQQLLREPLFHPNLESDDEQFWLPSQLTRAISSLSTYSEETQLEGLKVLLQCTCLQKWCLSQKTVLSIVQLCLHIYAGGSTATKTAAVATASQAVQAYISFLYESSATSLPDDQDQKSMDEGGYPIYEGQISPFDEVVPLLSFFCERLKEENRTASNSTTSLLLQCLQTALSLLKGEARKSHHFLDFVWQQLCPRLVGCLGSPQKDKNIVSAQRFEKGEMGRGSGCLATAPSCQGEEAKLVYSIAVELVKVVGEVGALRPVLGSLFHRMLLYPLPQHCLEPLKFVKEMLKNPEQLLQFAGPPLWEDLKNPRLSDLDLLKIVVDGLSECCHSKDPNVCYVSVECVVALLSSLETLVTGEMISDDLASCINAHYPTLQSADYVGASFLFEKSARSGFSNGWQHLEQGPMTLPASDNACLSESKGTDSEQQEAPPVSPSPSKDVAIEPALEACEEFDMKSLDGGTSSANEEKEMEVGDSGQEMQLWEGSLNQRGCTPVEESSNICEELTQDQATEGSIACDNDERIQSPEGDSSECVEVADVEMLERELQSEADDSHSIGAVSPIETVVPLMKEVNQSERDRLEKVFESNNEFAERERETARQFVERLTQFLPPLLHIRSSIEADQELQQLASDFSEALWKQQQHPVTESDSAPYHVTIVNADGIYLATYSALLLDLKLIRSGYRKGLSVDVPLTEEQFVDEVHGSGVLVYLSATWLSELYQRVLLCSFLEGAGYEPESKTNYALINLLTDMDGLGSDQLGSRQLSDYRRLERATANVVPTPAMMAGTKFARRVLTACWDTMLEVLSVLLNGTNSCGVASSLGLLLGTDGAKEDHRKAREAVANCLDGLQRAAKLYNVLGLQTKCGAIFAQLASACCPSVGTNATGNSDSQNAGSKRSRLRKSVLPNRNKSVQLHASHVLSMDVLLSRGLELGSHSAVCWQHVFRCCCYVLELERCCFQSKSSFSAPSQLRRQLTSFAKRGDKPQQASMQRPSLDSLFLDPAVECYGDEPMLDSVSMPGSVPQQNLNVADMVKSSTQAAGSCVLSGKNLQPIIEALSQLVDRLFDEAAGKLNLCALVGFLSELCAASRVQLFGRSQQGLQHPLLLLNRLGEVMLRCARGGRPLVHIMKAWSVVAPHLVEVACHKDQEIAKRAVASIHDIVGALLSVHVDLPHFHFNEALFKPFENILCLELCDVDIQEQIVSSICEFVEGSTAEIRSGWRPLFGALRAVRMSCPPMTTSCQRVQSSTSDRDQLERTHHLRVVLDVFDAFLGTDNPGVFANAAVDCLLCLLKHVRGPTELQDQGDQDTGLVEDLEPIPLNLCQAALKYLERCAQMLSSMYLMPACPVFHSALRIKLATEPNCVDPVIPDMELILFKDPDSASMNSGKDNRTDDKDDRAWYIQDDLDVVGDPPEEAVTLEELDRPTGVLHVWFLLLEGLAGAVATCPRKYQPHTIEALFQMLRRLHEVPGPEFGIYVMNHLLLPMLQGWLRRAAKTYRGWDSFATNFKQCCGLATELAVDYLIQLPFSETSTQGRGIHLMVYQLFLVLTECIAQPAEVVSRLGCACIRHLLVSGGPYLTGPLWRLASRSVRRASRVTLHSAQQLMVCFHADSENFYGDVGQAKVAVRRDCTASEVDRLRQLCRQVFLLDAQRTMPGTGCVGVAADVKTGVDDECSFIFLLHPPGSGAPGDPDAYVIRVPFRSLVVGLLSHQILLQTIATLMLEGTSIRLSALASVLGWPTQKTSDDSSAHNTGMSKLPGQLNCMPEEQVMELLEVLEESHSTATDFDDRPGLKFLVQKVARAEVAANLFKQAAISWAVQAVVLVELCLRHPDQPTMAAVNELVSQRSLNVKDSVLQQDHAEDPQKHITSLRSPEKVQGAAHSTWSSYASSDVTDGKDSPVCNVVGGNSKANERQWRRQFCHHSRSGCHGRDFGIVEHTISRERDASMDTHCKPGLNPYKRLRNLFRDLCDHYARVSSPEAKEAAILDHVGDQPIFFLMAQPDSLTELLPSKKKGQDRSDSVDSTTGDDHHVPPALHGSDTDSSSEAEASILEPDRVYSVITEKTLQSMVSEYKRHKTRHAMPPPSATTASRCRLPGTKRVSVTSDDSRWSADSASSPPSSRKPPPLPTDVEDQRRNSILKDAEAHVQVWSQLAQSVLELHLSLKEPDFLALVPVFYSGVEVLVAAGPSEPELRVLTADWLHRVALGLGFSGDSTSHHC